MGDDKRGRRDEKSRSRSQKRRRKDMEDEKALRAREEQRQKEEEERERVKLAEDAKRMDRTVMLVGLSLRADERNVFEFFTGRAGTVKDVQIIRDARTGRSKGVAYVEFGTAEGMVKALGMSGQTIQGAKVTIQQSQVAEGRGTKASRS
eukprot:TRINITY_DN64317_c0_g1_i1.p1 TRINITY_DN64317_c0_g1~~TRINITY_DN64317_c0_g1_i1.p1  ORF type:complete len:159 (-),score=37.20 TRINITY_DN64317_c0_g1_i1:82-528(-)